MDSIFSTVAVAVALAIGWIGAIPYIRSVIRRETKPHAVSWFLWSVLNGVNFAAELGDSIGPAMLLTANASFVSLLIVALSFRHGTNYVKRFDWICLGGALVAIAVWPIVRIPEVSVIISAAVNVFAFLPTMRKSYSLPRQENVAPFVAGMVQWSILVLSVNSTTVVSTLWGATSALLNGGLVFVILMRRRGHVQLAFPDHAPGCDCVELHRLAA